MAMPLRISSVFTAMREPSVSPPSCPSSSKALAIKFSRASSLKLQPQPQLRPSNVISNSSGLSPTRPRAMAASVQEALPPALASTSAPPNLFDGTTRLYISYTCPYAQRVWITRNCKGLQDKIQLVPIDLDDRPAWYKEKVYPPNKVPALEHNNEVRGESLDLMKYIDNDFEGPSLLPDDSTKREFAEDLLSYTGTFYKTVVSSFKEDVNVTEAGNVAISVFLVFLWLIITKPHNATGTAFDYIESALSKFDGPFFLGQFSLVDIAYAPFVERFRPFLMDVKNHDITEGRPKLAAWLEEMNKIDAYKQTCHDPKELVERYKKRFLARL
ncbi:protein IN2-1 homolog B-like isoform X1 [Prosopis cineraria]|uniref:protein IN2-1 homolog B-like isoform X1 n=1 Tax=Prosopis cineraria TaxID=364024 RepID=UPI00240FED0C|nr:protein IN2-1 homolog B-like isoform X1 [Prosopis cineraria]